MLCNALMLASCGCRSILKEESNPLEAISLLLLSFNAGRLLAPAKGRSADPPFDCAHPTQFEAARLPRDASAAQPICMPTEASSKERRCLLLATAAASMTSLLPCEAFALRPLSDGKSDYILNAADTGKTKILRTPDYYQYDVELPLQSKKVQILQPFGALKASMKFDYGDSFDDRTGLKVWSGGSDLCRGASTGQLRMSADGSVNPVIIKGRRVLELGSGTGVAGIGAAIGGAAFVVATDGNEDLVRLVQKNVDLNKVDCTTANRLRWGNTADEAKVFDAGPFDVVMASEVGYNDAKLAALFGTMRRCMLKAKGAGVTKPEAVLQVTLQQGQFDEELLKESGVIPIRTRDAFLGAARKAGLKLATEIEVNDSQRFLFDLA